MFTDKQHAENLSRHIGMVQDRGILLADRLRDAGRKSFARRLLANIFIHDASKWNGIEFEWLHRGKEANKAMVEMAVKQHTATNPHHPEYWDGGFEEMPPIYLAEMVCDWYARSSELATGLRDWINGTAVDKFQIDIYGEKFQIVQGFVDMLVDDPFVR